MRLLRRLYFKLFKRYRRLEYRVVTYYDGDTMIRATAEMVEPLQWQIAKEEDKNRCMGAVCLERRERIKE